MHIWSGIALETILSSFLTSKSLSAPGFSGAAELLYAVRGSQQVANDQHACTFWQMWKY